MAVCDLTDWAVACIKLDRLPCPLLDEGELTPSVFVVLGVVCVSFHTVCVHHQ